MMKNMESKKITALGVVIFSFLSILAGLFIVVLMGAVSSLMVLKTNLPEGIIKIGSAFGGGFGVLSSAFILTKFAKLKGIISAGVISALYILIKIIGNAGMHLEGYLSIRGLIGVVLIVLFSFVGSIFGSMGKRG